eukprot:m.58485 g.58485  ORF g.58485 m.58485 type:complete len:592 (+) comp12873_c0_seq1:118-1893(+)
MLVRTRVGEFLANIVDNDAAVCHANGKLVARRVPLHPVDGLLAIANNQRHNRHLGVEVDVPKVEAAHSVGRDKEGWMDRRPLHVIHVVTSVFKRIQRLARLLRTPGRPQLDGPVGGRANKQVVKVGVATRRPVVVNARDRACVSLKGFCDATLGLVPRRRVDGTLFRTRNKVVNVPLAKGNACGCNGLRGTVLQFHDIAGLHHLFKAPGAQLAIGRNSDVVMGVLCPHNIHAVHRVRVRLAGKCGALHWRALHANVPQHNLAGIGSAQHIVGLKRRKARRKHGRLAFKCVFWAGGQFQTPNLNNAVGVIGCVWVGNVRCRQQLRVLGVPVEVGDGTARGGGVCKLHQHTHAVAHRHVHFCICFAGAVVDQRVVVHVEHALHEPCALVEKVAKVCLLQNLRHFLLRQLFGGLGLIVRGLDGNVFGFHLLGFFAHARVDGSLFHVFFFFVVKAELWDGVGLSLALVRHALHGRNVDRCLGNRRQLRTPGAAKRSLGRGGGGTIGRRLTRSVTRGGISDEVGNQAVEVVAVGTTSGSTSSSILCLGTGLTTLALLLDAPQLFPLALKLSLAVRHDCKARLICVGGGVNGCRCGR